MKIIAASIDLNKIDKSRIKTVDKDGNPFKNGAKYYEISILLNSTPDKYGNHASIVESQTKDEREMKAEKKFIGNGKIVFSNSPESKEVKETPLPKAEPDDLPF